MRVDLQGILIRREIIEYVKKYPGCGARAIASTLSPEFKNKNLSSRRIGQIIARDLKEEVRREKAAVGTSYTYYPINPKPKPQSTTHEEGLDYVVEYFIDKNNFPITLYEISDYLGNKISEDNLEIILNKAFFIETKAKPKPTRYKLKDSFYQYYLENKK